MQCTAILLIYAFTNVNGYEDIHDDRSLLDRIEEQTKNDKQSSANGEQDEEEEYEIDGKDKRSSVYDFLYKRLKQDANGESKRKRLTPNVYMIPGPQEPLPGRSHLGDYWPVFPFQNQFSGGLDLDPSISRHIGGDMNIAVPSWGMLDIYGRFFNRIHDTTTKFGYVNYPVNMLDLEKEDFVKLMSDPSLQYNRNAQPRLPLGKLARTYVPINCKPPMCNPYHANFGFGMEHDFGGNDGVEGDIDVPIPISKGVAYRVPFSGKVYAFWDNITVTYGQNLAPVDPFMSLFEYQKHRDPGLAIPRRRRDVSHSKKIWFDEPTSATYEDHLKEPTSTTYEHQLKSYNENKHRVVATQQGQSYKALRLVHEPIGSFYPPFPGQIFQPVSCTLQYSQATFYEDFNSGPLLCRPLFTAPLISRIPWFAVPPFADSFNERVLIP
uniref:Secreted protein n=1 Tax=Haemonchus contortus TaxID=6289 RepID=A0A7I4YM99_HAECO